MSTTSKDEIRRTLVDMDDMYADKETDIHDEEMTAPFAEAKDYQDLQFDAENPLFVAERKVVERKAETAEPLEVDVKKLLIAFLRVFEPKAINDGRLQKLVEWEKQRGIEKLRAMLREVYGADLYAPNSVNKTPAFLEQQQNPRLSRRRALMSLFGL
jgi:hypothetical protein